MKIIDKFILYIDKKQFCPTTEDLENEELAKLAKRLKGNSEKETLTNILEWQEKNIQYWVERRNLPLIFIIDLFVLLTLFIFFKNMSVISGVLVATAVFGIAYPIMSYCFILRERQTKNKILKLVKMTFDTFRGSMPVNKILEYRMGICRDYAKLTASLLFNIYPDSKVCFITILMHVTIAIKIRGKYYILDKHPPVLTLNKWVAKWRILYKIGDVIRLNRIYVSEVLEKVEFNEHEKMNEKAKLVLPEVDTGKLAEEIAKMLKISQKSQKGDPDFEIPLKGFATYYEDDEIVIYSLARTIKNKIESEFCGNTDKISRIETIQNGKDLIVKVYLLDNY